MGLQTHHRHSIRLKGYDYSQAGAYFITICCQDRINLFGAIKNGVMQLHDAGKMVEKWYWELGNKFPDMQCDEMIIMPNHIHFIVINVGADLRVCPNILGEHILDEHILDEHIPGEHISGEHIPGEHISDEHISDEHISDEHILDEHISDEHISGEHILDEHISGEHILDEHILDEHILGEHILDEHILGEHILDEHISDEHIPGEHIGSPLHAVVQWFKTMTTNAYIRGVASYNWQRFNKRMWQRNYYEHIIRNETEYNRIVQYIIDNSKFKKEA